MNLIDGRRLLQLELGKEKDWKIKSQAIVPKFGTYRTTRMNKIFLTTLSLRELMWSFTTRIIDLTINI